MIPQQVLADYAEIGAFREFPGQLGVDTRIRGYAVRRKGADKERTRVPGEAV